MKDNFDLNTNKWLVENESDCLDIRFGSGLFFNIRGFIGRIFIKIGTFIEKIGFKIIGIKLF